jgi:uncharacterized repeat protein (TIGR01451 family)
MSSVSRRAARALTVLLVLVCAPAAHAWVDLEAYIQPQNPYGTDEIGPDEQIEYTVQVIYNGDGSPSPSNVTLTVSSSDAVDFDSLEFLFGAGDWTCAAPVAGPTPSVSCTASSIGGGDHYFRFKGRSPSVAGAPSDGFLHLSATVTAANVSVSTELNPVNNSRTQDIAFVLPEADLSVAVADSPDPLTADANGTWTIDYANAGPADAANASVTIGDNGTQFQSLVAPAGWSCTTPAVGATGAITCTKASVADGETGTFTLVGKASGLGSADGTISTTASIDSDTDDSDADDNSDTETTAYDAPDRANLGVTLAAVPATVAPGGDATYTVTVTNAGPDPAAGVQLSLPSTGALFVSLAAPAGWSCTTPAVGAAGAITCTRASFASGATSTFTYVARAAQATFGDADATITQTAAVTGATIDATAANDAASAAVAYDAPEPETTTTGTATTPAPTPVLPASVPEPAAPPIAPPSCLRRTVLLLDVHREGDAVVAAGLADPRYAGRRASLVGVAPSGERTSLGSADVGPDGRFSGAAGRGAPSSRYLAQLAGQASVALALDRRVRIVGTATRGGRLVVTYRIDGERPGRAVLLRRAPCGTATVAGRPRVGRGGLVTVALPGPAKPGRLWLYRLAVADSGENVTDVSLPLAVAAG